MLIACAEFDKEFKNEAFRREIYEHCKKERNEENVEFLELVLQYRSAALEDRVEMQKKIYEKFIATGGKKQLNISTDLSNGVAAKMEKFLGDEDVFETVETFVKTMLMQDSYARLKNNALK